MSVITGVSVSWRAKKNWTTMTSRAKGRRARAVKEQRPSRQLRRGGGKGPPLKKKPHKGLAEYHQAHRHWQEEQCERPHRPGQSPGQRLVVLLGRHLGREGQQYQRQSVGHDGGQRFGNLAGVGQGRYAPHANPAGKGILHQRADEQRQAEGHQQRRSQTAHRPHRRKTQVQARTEPGAGGDRAPVSRGPTCPGRPVITPRASPCTPPSTRKKDQGPGPKTGHSEGRQGEALLGMKRCRGQCREPEEQQGRHHQPCQTYCQIVLLTRKPGSCDRDQGRG